MTTVPQLCASVLLAARLSPHKSLDKVFPSLKKRGNGEVRVNGRIPG